MKMWLGEAFVVLAIFGMVLSCSQVDKADRAPDSTNEEEEEKSSKKDVRHSGAGLYYVE